MKDEEEDKEYWPQLELLSVEVWPNHCMLDSELNLILDFSLDRPVAEGTWKVKLVVDCVHARHIVELGETRPVDYPQGSSSMNFKHPQLIDTGYAFEKSALTNAGLLTASLCERGKEVVTINMLVMVEESDQGPVKFLRRHIYSPLE